MDDESARAEFAEFQGSIRAADAAVGTLLDAVERNGLARDTVFVFTADHGVPFPRAKCSLHDPGIEVPLLVRWPAGGWTGGRVLGALIANVDLVPTLLDAAGVAVPAGVQGRTLAPLLDGRDDGGGRDAVFAEMTYHDYYDPRRCIRTRNHKLIANFSTAPFFMDPSQSRHPATTTVVPDAPELAYHPHVECYDLRTDPWEQGNLAADPRAATVRDELLGRLHAWMVATGDPLLGGVPLSPHHLRTMELLSRAAASRPPAEPTPSSR